MGWLSILPDHLSAVETWVARIFLLLGLVTMGPWALLLVYDLLYYFWRTATYEIPVVGGRAKGKRRPRAPSLTERPSGDKRTLNVPLPATTSGTESQDSNGDSSKRRYAQDATVDGGG